MISLVVAASENGVIGIDGQLPWRLPDDLRYFKRLTTGKPVLMGRRTYDSIGRPLPDRLNIVMTRNAGFSAPGCEVAASPESAVELAGRADEIMVIGGATIYEQFASIAERIYLTRVQANIDGDAFFAIPDPDTWRQISSEQHPADERHAYAFDFLVYERHCRRNGRRVMDKVKRDRLVEALSTFRGALRLFFFSGYTVGFVLLGLLAAGRGYLDGWMARAFFIGVRWYQLRWIIQEFRKRGAYDVDGDGRTDSFADKFLDDL